MSTGSSTRLSEQQQRRITDNFRAAKAKLAKKRPYSLSPSRSIPSAPSNSCNVENEYQMRMFHGERFPPTSPNLRSTIPAKRICNPTLPDQRERIPMGMIPANNILASPQFGASLNPLSTCSDFGDVSSGASCQMPASFLTSMSDESFKECPPREKESEYVLPGDICEDFDERILEELDEICKKQSKFPTEIGAECIEPSSKLPLELCSTTFFHTVQDPLVQHLDSLHGLKLRPSQGSTLVACSTVTELSSVSSHMPDHTISVDLILGGEVGLARDNCFNELPALGDEVLSTQYSAAEHTTTVTGVPQDNSKSLSSPPKVNSTSCVVSVLPPPTAQSTDKTTCDAELPDHLKRLNDSQREAALSDTLKPLLILAGPGSGKTSTMVARVLTLLREGVEAKCILAMTFTTAAATEMRQRVSAAIGKATSKELTISTFHSFCLQLCRAHADKLGRSAEFLVYGHGQQRRAVIEATRLATKEIQTDQAESVEIDSSRTEESETDSNFNPSMWKDKAKKWQQFVTQAKSAGRTSLDYEKTGNAFGAAVLRHYEATLAACDAMDYHDFISFSVMLLEKYPEVLNECQKTWTCVLVDEFQDTSRMQYRFLRLLASHNRITIVGDDDQSIFSFNGANASGFDSFRQHFPMLKEVRLHQNYRSTRSIVEAATSLIQYNKKRCQEKQAHTLNDAGEKIAVVECRTEAAECSFVVDSILMNAAGQSSSISTFGSIAVLYRRQVTGRMFQATFRSRKIPFNVHGVAFYRKKIIKSVISILRTVLPGNTDIYWRRVLKALFSGDKSDCKRIIEYVDKVARSNNTSFHQAAQTIFTAKVSGTFSRKQLALGRRVLTSINMVHRLALKERSLSELISAVVSLLPQRPVFNSRAVVDENGGKLLNEDDDPRTVLEYFLDDVNEFLSNFCSSSLHCDEDDSIICGQVPQENGGCLSILKAFLDHLSSREAENFHQRKQDNKNSVTLTTMHQSKGLEWDTVYIVKANDTETPLLNEGKGQVADDSCSIEEERRLFYVAMTRARKKLYICYVVTDSQRQVLQASRFLKELPRHLLHFQGDSEKINVSEVVPDKIHSEICRDCPRDFPTSSAIPSTAFGNNAAEGTVLQGSVGTVDLNDEHNIFANEEGSSEKRGANMNGDLESVLFMDTENGATASMFLRGFNMEARSTVAALFNSWARKPAFQDPKRLLSKVGFVVDERLRSKKTKNKEVLIALKCCLRDDAALAFATNAIKWARLPPEERALLQAERQEHFQQQSSERSMSVAAATSKQIAFLRSLGCTTDPTSRLHASKLIEQYKKL